MASANEKYYYPILAYSEIEKKSKEKIMAIWDRFDLLTEDKKEKISSQKTAEEIKIISQRFALLENQIIIISRTIRDFYFGSVNLEDFPLIFYKEMGINLDEAKEISQIVIQKIIQDQSQEKNYSNISLDAALKQYPELVDQLITSQPIKARTSQDMIRPSIKNWLADYTYNLGYDHHDSITRGNYLFQSENTKTLSSQDRQKLSYILKSFDDKTPIMVNVSTKQVVFPAETSSQETGIRNQESRIMNQGYATPASRPSIVNQGIELRRTQAPKPVSAPGYSAPRPKVNPALSNENNHPWAQVVQRPEEIAPAARQAFRPTAPNPIRTERPVSPPVNNFNRPPANLLTNNGFDKSSTETRTLTQKPPSTWSAQNRFRINTGPQNNEPLTHDYADSEYGEDIRPINNQPLKNETDLIFTPAPKHPAYKQPVNNNLHEDNKTQNPADNSLVLGFTSPQKLPYEKEREEIHRPVPPVTPAPEPLRPMRISPVTNNGFHFEEDLPGNVVNLKE